MEEYKNERKQVQSKIDNLQKEIDTIEGTEDFNFTPQDILLKRDIDYINKVKLKEEYKKRTRTWKDFSREDRSIIRVFPLDDYYKKDPKMEYEIYKFGIIYIRGTDEFQMEEVSSAFDYIPDETNTSVIYTYDKKQIEIGVKPVKLNLLEKN